MDFDGAKEKEFVNWKYEEKDMKNLRTLTAVFTPAIMVCFLFSLNVINLQAKKAPMPSAAPMEELSLVEDSGATWYAQLAKMDMKSKALAKR